jgi:hypothetical protein
MVVCRAAGILASDSVRCCPLRRAAGLRRSVTKMNKLIVLLLALGIVGAFIGGCSSAEEPADSTTTTGATDDTNGE